MSHMYAGYACTTYNTKYLDEEVKVAKQELAPFKQGSCKTTYAARWDRLSVFTIAQPNVVTAGLSYRPW